MLFLILIILVASESLDGRCTPDQTVPSVRLFLRNREHYSSTQSLLKDSTSSKSTVDYHLDSPSYPLTVIEEGSREFEVIYIENQNDYDFYLFYLNQHYR